MGGIIWLASFPKSGNTWVRAFLANYIADTAKPLPFAKYDQLVRSDADYQWYRTRVGNQKGVEGRRKIAEVRAEVQADLVKRFPNNVVVKTHNYLGTCAGHPLINTKVTAGAVYLVRNPLDVVISFAKHMGQSLEEAITSMASSNGFIEGNNRKVFEFTNDWSTHVESWTEKQHPRLCVMRYEDMLKDTRGSFANIAGFLQLETTGRRFDRAVRHSSFKVLKAMEQTGGFRERSHKTDAFFRKGRTDQWRDVLNEDQVGRIVERHREQMTRYDYIPDGY